MYVLYVEILIHVAFRSDTKISYTGVGAGNGSPICLSLWDSWENVKECSISYRSSNDAHTARTYVMRNGKC